MASQDDAGNYDCPDRASMSQRFRSYSGLLALIPASTVCASANRRAIVAAVSGNTLWVHDGGCGWPGDPDGGWHTYRFNQVDGQPVDGRPWLEARGVVG